MPNRPQGLTPRKRRFIKLLPTAKTAREAAIQAGYPPAGASVMATRLQQDPQVHAAIEAEMERQGLTDSCLVKNLKAGLGAKVTRFFQHEGKVTDRRDCIDFPTRHKYLHTAFQLKGALTSPEDGMAAAVGLTAIIAIIRAERAARGLTP